MIADSIEDRYKNALQPVGKIQQAMLANAFRGELVEPHPDDEPAEVLLGNIAEERGSKE